MSAQDKVKAVQLEAAHALSRILSQQGILHAFIGGFGVRLLGAPRPTEDIDAIVDISDPLEIVSRIRPLLQEQDSRFSIEGLKLYFTSEAAQQVRVTVEILAVGTLGLPPHITAFLVMNGMQPSSTPCCTAKANIAKDLPLLSPGILILTKIKRWVTLSESTRPLSILKAEKDMKDITYLLRWLVEHKENIDFAGYKAAHPERLLDAARQLVRIERRNGNANLLEVLFSVLTEEDLVKIKDG